MSALFSHSFGRIVLSCGRVPSRRAMRLGLSVLLLLLLTACSTPEAPEPTEVIATETPAPTNTPEPTATATAVPTDTPTPEPTATPGPLSSAEIFERVSPAVVYIDIGASSGSGIVIEHGYVVTNAHVVWPNTSVRLVAPGRDEIRNVTVVGWDLLADIAVLGPVEELADRAVSLVDGEGLPTGAEVYLIGYPAESERTPEPTITQGVLSRQREWAATLTLLQTDASIAGGQSGGALVSEMGEVIGISGLRFSEAGFGLASSASDLLPRITALMAGEIPAEVGPRTVLSGAAKEEYRFTLQDGSRSYAVVINPRRGDTIEIAAESVNDLVISTDSLGAYGWYTWETADDTTTGTEQMTLEVPAEAPVYVLVEQHGQTPAAVRLTASHSMVALLDPDDYTTFAKGDTVYGSFDFPGDDDYFVLEVERNEVVNLYVTSLTADPYLEAGYQGEFLELDLYDDDSGDGIFGMDASLTIRAGEAGGVLVRVSDYNGGASGSYVLQARRHQSDYPKARELAPPSVPIESPFGPMRERYFGESGSGFTLQVPADWTGGQVFDEDLGDADAIKYEYQGQDMQMEVTLIPLPEMEPAPFADVAEAADFFETVWERFLGPELTRESRTTITTTYDKPAVVLDYRTTGLLEGARMRFLITLHEEWLLALAFAGPAESFNEIEPMIDYTFSTLDLR